MINFFKRLLKNKYFLLTIIILGYEILLLGTFKYPGFVGKHFFADAKVWAGVVLFFLLFGSCSGYINIGKVIIGIRKKLLI